MMKRRLLALLLALTMTVALTACGGKETAGGKQRQLRGGSAAGAGEP